jgi:integrase
VATLMASPKRSDGEGSLYQLHKDECPRTKACPCPWQASYVTGWQDGRPVRRKVSAKSRADCTRKLQNLKEKVNAGTLPAGRVPTVGEWLTVWLDQIAAAKVRPNTLRGYRTYVDRYLIPLLGSHRLDRLSPEHVEKAWAELLTTGRPQEGDSGRPVKPLSSTSAHQAHRILARALKVAQQRGYVQRNVATLVDAPSVDSPEMKPLTKVEAKRVLAAAEETRLQARWSLALSLGLRQGEALGLTWPNVNLDEGTIAVRQALSRQKGKGLVLGPVKSRAGKRILSIPKPLLTELRAHRRAQNAERLAAGTWWAEGEFVFTTAEGRPIDPRADWAAWRDLLEAANVDPVRLHDARHTAATFLLAKGIPLRVVMEFLGHSQISVTSKYQHVLDEMQVAASDAIGDTLWGS